MNCEDLMNMKQISRGMKLVAGGEGGWPEYPLDLLCGLCTVPE